VYQLALDVRSSNMLGPETEAQWFKRTPDWKFLVFHYDALHWVTFLAAAFLLNVSPGPDIAFILGQTIKSGRSNGFAAMFGIWTGALGHVVMASLGLSAILVASATAFTAIKWIGAAYLVWLGISALLAKTASFGAEAKTGSHDLISVYRQGILVCLLNPKVAIFFLAFLPQFVVPGAGPVWAQLLLHGSLIIAVAGVVEPPLVVAGAWLGRRVQHNASVGLWLERGMGAVLVALGVRLAMSER
jgi:threonine/homoserine/homoserine lactone efflux protein